MKLFSKDFLYQHNYISVSEIPLDEIKKFFENNINTISAQVLHIYTKNPYLNIFYLDENNKKGNKENDEIIINQIAFPKDINRITYFNDLDKSFLKNPKKKIMNNIFSIYYLDIFYYNRTFRRMRDYFINKILDNSIAGIKLLDFPSKIKNFRNNLEPPLFIKEYKDCFNNPIFPISYQYINHLHSLRYPVRHPSFKNNKSLSHISGLFWNINFIKVLDMNELNHPIFWNFRI